MAEEWTFLFIDVDGYCAGGVDQRTILGPGREGYRARELGWAYYSAAQHEGGSIYFYDEETPLDLRDPSIPYTWGLHALAVRPKESDYAGETVLPSSGLLVALEILHRSVWETAGRPVVFVHKGGNEGVWARRAVPNAPIIDLGLLGCPKVDVLGRGRADFVRAQQCPYHAPARRRTGKVVHCPRLEVLLLAEWAAGLLSPAPGLAAANPSAPATGPSTPTAGPGSRSGYWPPLPSPPPL
jgi:hypothetical protein